METNKPWNLGDAIIKLQVEVAIQNEIIEKLIELAKINLQVEEINLIRKKHQDLVKKQHPHIEF